MMKALKQVLGVDVSQKELVVTLGRVLENLDIELYSHRIFANRESGFIALVKWLSKQTETEVKVQVLMEATGVYHEKFAYYLDAQKYELSIVLPNKISNYQRTMEVKTVNDKSCSEAIAHFGLSRNVEAWQKPKKVYKTLQQLTRERGQVMSERSMVKNQLHAELSEAYPNERSVGRLNARIVFLNQQEKEIKTDIDGMVNKDPDLKKEVARLSTIPGVAKLTATIILAETNGFELIRNKKQLTSYAGLDIKEKQSGTSVKGKPKISKRGNRNLRKAMFFPSMTAVSHDENFRDMYARLVSKHGLKMKGLVAVQRKLLELTYTLFKNKSTYDKLYEAKKLEEKNSVSAQMA